MARGRIERGGAGAERLIAMPVRPPVELTAAWDEHSMASRCDGSPAWSMSWEAVLRAGEPMELFALWHPSTAGPRAAWMDLDAQSQAALFLRRGHAIGLMSRGSLDPMGARALASLLMPRTPPIALRLGPQQAVELDALGLDNAGERFAAAQRIAGTDFQRDFGDLALPVAGWGTVGFLDEPAWEASVGGRRGLLRARDQARALGEGLCAPPASGKRRGI